MGDGEEYQLVQSNKASPTSQDLIEEVAMQASWSHRSTAWHSAVLSQEKHCCHIWGGGSFWHGAGSHGTWLDRKARSGSKQPRASRIVAGELGEQPALSGFTTATRKPESR